MVRVRVLLVQVVACFVIYSNMHKCACMGTSGLNLDWLAKKIPSGFGSLDDLVLDIVWAAVDAPVFLPTDDELTYLKKAVKKSFFGAKWAAGVNSGFFEKLKEEVMEDFLRSSSYATFIAKVTAKVMSRGVAESIIKERISQADLADFNKWIAKLIARRAVKWSFEQLFNAFITGGAKAVEKISGREVVAAAFQGSFSKGVKAGLLGGSVEAFSFAYSVYASAKMRDEGKISDVEFCQFVVKRLFATVGSVSGGAIGSGLGTVYIPIPWAGTFFCGVIGSVGGDFAGSKVGSLVSYMLCKS